MPNFSRLNWLSPGERPMVFAMARKCPTCNRDVKDDPAKDAQRFLPFCSERCRMADLGKWLDGAYRIGTPVTEDDLDQGIDLDREPEA